MQSQPQPSQQEIVFRRNENIVRNYYNPNPMNQERIQAGCNYMLIYRLRGGSSLFLVPIHFADMPLC